MLKTKEQRRRDIQRLFLSKKKEKEKIAQKEEKEKYIYPQYISTLSKRIKRLDPSYGVQSMEYHDCAYIVYYKLKQSGFKDLRIICTAKHAWVEFLYNDEWWIFDPIAIRELELGDPIKRKQYVKEDVYRMFARIFTDIGDYKDAYENRINYTEDEAKIAAMKDVGLNSTLRHKLI